MALLIPGPKARSIGSEVMNARLFTTDGTDSFVFIRVIRVIRGQAERALRT
jgi:hypothetical protein